MLYMTNTRSVAESPTGSYNLPSPVNHILGHVRCTNLRTISRIMFLVQQFDTMVESYVFRISDQFPNLFIHNLRNMIKIRPLNKPVRIYRNTHQYLTPVPQKVLLAVRVRMPQYPLPAYLGHNHCSDHLSRC